MMALANVMPPTLQPAEPVKESTMSNPHKYNTPEWMIYRLTEWIGQNGGEDSTTLMVHEAKETIKKFVAQQNTAQTLGAAIVEAAQRLGIASDDHSSYSGAQLIHLLACIESEVKRVQLASGEDAKDAARYRIRRSHSEKYNTEYDAESDTLVAAMQQEPQP